MGVNSFKALESGGESAIRRGGDSPWGWRASRFGGYGAMNWLAVRVCNARTYTLLTLGLLGWGGRVSRGGIATVTVTRPVSPNIRWHRIGASRDR